jgi:Flp pilus assembly protein TadD
MPPHSTTETLRLAADLHRRGDIAGAQRLYGEILALDPDNTEALRLAGIAAADHGNPIEAVKLLRRAAQLDPRSPIVRLNLAATLAGLGRADAALAAIDQAVALGPELPVVHRLRGDLLQSMGRFEAALKSCARGADLAPHDAAIRVQYGNVLAMVDRMDEALRAFEEALVIDPRSAEAHKQRAVALTVLQRHAEALVSLERAVSLAPTSADARYTRAVLLLTIGDYARGFREHEWRWHSRLTSSSLERRSFAQPLWLGREPIGGRRILLYSEQGLGDTLQFCRYVSAVAERGATVLLQVQRPLVGLLRRLPGVSGVIGEDESPPPFDFHCPLMSLPLACDTRVDDVPAPRAYLQADPDRTVTWQQRLGERRAPRVGLMWNGNPDNPSDHYRSFRLADWLRHLPAGFEYYSLQRFIRIEDRGALRRGVVRDLSKQQTDFGDAAALCECMDIVISVCTSIAHLSGALGRPTWILLSQQADWRWLLDRRDSPWYPTAKLYRQSTRGDWAPVFARVSEDLLREFHGDPKPQEPHFSR